MAAAVSGHGFPSLTERRKGYEAMCQSKPKGDAASTAARAKPSAVAERMRQRFGGRETAGSFRVPTLPPVPKRKLANVTEQRVLKIGVRWLHKVFVMDQDVDISELPRRPDGSTKVLQAAFFSKLLNNRIELKGSLESDVAAAQLDLRHLSTEQLLTMRSETLDFLTECEKHNAHNNFLTILDGHLFEKITRLCCERSQEGGGLPDVRQQALHSVGLRIALTVGAARVFAEGLTEGQKQEEPLLDEPILPTCWLIRLDDQVWKGSRYAVFSVAKLTYKVVSENLDFSGLVPAEEHLAVVHDRSSGSGKDRMMFWEVAILDPHRPGEEVALEIERRSGISSSNRKFSSDLEEAVRKRSETSSFSEVASLKSSLVEVLPMVPDQEQEAGGDLPADILADQGVGLQAADSVAACAPPGEGMDPLVVAADSLIEEATLVASNGTPDEDVSSRQ